MVARHNGIPAVPPRPGRFADGGRGAAATSYECIHNFPAGEGEFTIHADITLGDRTTAHRSRERPPT